MAAILMGVAGATAASVGFDFDGTDVERIDSGTPSAGYTFQTDGQGELFAGGFGTFTKWWGAFVTGIGTGKYVRLVRTGGTKAALDSLDAQNTWYELTVARSFYITRFGGAGTDTWTGRVELGYDGATAAYVSDPITFTAQDIL